MAEDSGSLVWWILLPLLLAVGIYLASWSKRQNKHIEKFARKNRLPVKNELREKVEETLEACFSIERDGLVRHFEQLSGIIQAGPVYLFRTVELLDLNPHIQAYSTHFSRCAALFDVPANFEEFFVLTTSGEVTTGLQDARNPDPSVIAAVKQSAASCNAPHSLSITLAKGKGLIYFETLVKGAQSEADMKSLLALAKSLRQQLNNPV